MDVHPRSSSTHGILVYFDPCPSLTTEEVLHLASTVGLAGHYVLQGPCWGKLRHAVMVKVGGKLGQIWED